jgi:hypothetical protein
MEWVDLLQDVLGGRVVRDAASDESQQRAAELPPDLRNVDLRGRRDGVEG